MEAVIKKCPKNRSPGLDSFIGGLYQTFKEELTSILLKLFQKIQEEGTLPSSSYEARKQMKTLQRKKIIGQYP